MVSNKVGVKVFLIFDQKVLSILRDDNPQIVNPNVWSLPGGGVEAGETNDQGIVREVNEELEISLKEYKCLGREDFPDGRSVTRYVADLSDRDVKQIKLHEGQRYEFFTIAEMLELPLPQDLRNYLTKNQAYLKEIIENGATVGLDQS